MKKGTKRTLFVVGIIGEVVVETVADTMKEYRDHLLELKERREYIERLKKENIGGDTLRAAIISYKQQSEKIKKDDKIFWKALTKKSQREEMAKWDKEVAAM